MISFTNRCC